MAPAAKPSFFRGFSYIFINLSLDYLTNMFLIYARTDTGCRLGGRRKMVLLVERFWHGVLVRMCARV